MNILITSHLSQKNSIKRNSVTSDLADFLFQRDCLPIMALLPHNLELVNIDEIVAKYLSICDAVVLTGGADYGSQPIRDIFELCVIQLALAQNKPILGICRGMQILNVAFGGSLKNLLDTHCQNQNGDSIMESNIEDMNTKKLHKITLSGGSMLNQWLNLETLLVNSIHSQSVDSIGQNLEVEAVSCDGVIEALSYKKGQILGVQWHPELDLEDINQQKIIQYWLKTSYTKSKKILSM